jgi:hypothetical protein
VDVPDQVMVEALNALCGGGAEGVGEGEHVDNGVEE